jgi:aminoglycoside 6'-N-acetyltransferase I
MHIEAMKKEDIGECVDLFMDVFSKEPWNDVYDSREQVAGFFQRHMENNYFVGYVFRDGAGIAALSIGMKKPWIQGMEYYIDEFCVKTSLQGRGVGSEFLKCIETEIKSQGMNAMLLNTEKGFPSEKFYAKNGFQTLENLILLAK